MTSSDAMFKAGEASTTNPELQGMWIAWIALAGRLAIAEAIRELAQTQVDVESMEYEAEQAARRQGDNPQ